MIPGWIMLATWPRIASDRTRRLGVKCKVVEPPVPVGPLFVLSVQPRWSLTNLISFQLRTAAGLSGRGSINQLQFRSINQSINQSAEQKCFDNFQRCVAKGFSWWWSLKMRECPCMTADPTPNTLCLTEYSIIINQHVTDLAATCKDWTERHTATKPQGSNSGIVAVVSSVWQ